LWLKNMRSATLSSFFNNCDKNSKNSQQRCSNQYLPSHQDQALSLVVLD
jgi:hypothetical protein